ncbi:unnamed protein product, partial [Mesorhabditis spiculigera]
MSGLQFQSFTNADFSASDPNPGQIGDKTEATSDPSAGPKRNFFSFGYYQQFFDVDADQVTKRLLNSAIPTHNSFIADFIQPVPDLYGPFWVAVTLVFSIGIFSNIAQYIENEGGTGEYGSDFGMVTGASSLITAYLVLIPLILYSIIWYRKSEVQFSYFEILCAYGYSLTVFIPVSFLWIIDIGMLRWALIGVSVTLSGTVLVKALWPAFKNDSNKLLSFGVTFGIIFLHFVLALCFKEYFFDPIHGRPSTPVVVPTEKPADVIPTLPASVASLPGKVEEPAKPKTEGQLAANVANTLAAAGEVAKAAENKTNVDAVPSPSTTLFSPVVVKNDTEVKKDETKAEPAAVAQ